MSTEDELVGVKTRFENCSESDLNSYLYYFENKWIFKNNKNINVVVSKAYENFGLDENFTYEQLNESYKKSLYNVIYLSMELRKVMNNDDFVEI